jgi:hypothetical protein
MTVTYEPCPGCGREPIGLKTPPSYKRATCEICHGAGMVKKETKP